MNEIDRFTAGAQTDPHHERVPRFREPSHGEQHRERQKRLVRQLADMVNLVFNERSPSVRMSRLCGGTPAFWLKQLNMINRGVLPRQQAVREMMLGIAEHMIGIREHLDEIEQRRRSIGDAASDADLFRAPKKHSS